ncbi:MAG: radical SAM protein [Euryarchaeota archaeon]|nr:radical SAM protein [Euryarchaeota archaeon]
MSAEIKALLIAEGGVDIDERLLGRVTTPASGPGAGLKSFFFRFGNHRVRLGVKHGSRYKATLEGDEVVIREGEREIIRGYLEDALAHCPEQAFITVSERCIFDCKYCPVPLLGGHIKSTNDVIKIIEEIERTPALRSQLKAISLTTGVEESAEEEVKRIAQVVRAVRRFNVPIGVEVYPTADSNRLLKEAGATEIKYNVETVDRRIFKRVCPGLSIDAICAALSDAVQLFGKNHVFTNILIGLGESDETVIAGMEKLARLGVISSLRAVVEHPLRAEQTEMRRPSAERLLRLARKEREILDKHGLRADFAETMCAACTGCDLIPHKDV